MLDKPAEVPGWYPIYVPIYFTQPQKSFPESLTVSRTGYIYALAMVVTRNLFWITLLGYLWLTWSCFRRWILYDRRCPCCNFLLRGLYDMLAFAAYESRTFVIITFVVFARNVPDVLVRAGSTTDRGRKSTVRIHSRLNMKRRYRWPHYEPDYGSDIQGTDRRRVKRL